MIQTILSKLGYKADTLMQQYISDWDDWYKGYVEKVHKYTTYNGKVRIGQKRASLKMAKRVCEDWANLLLNEKVSFACADTDADNKLKRALSDNDFYVRANQLVEKAFAFGSGAFVEYADVNGKTVIDFITADKIYPLSWVDINITDCAFASIKTIGGQKYYYINIHTSDARGRYIIQNRLFDEYGIEVSLPAGIKSQYISAVKRFQIIRPNITNNIEPCSPMGISIFANAVNELEGVDLVYDSYINEFKLGKKRMLIPVTMAQLEKEKEGISAPVFDNNDTVFYAIPGIEGENQKPTEINMEIRGEEHKQAVQYNLSLLADKCGLGNDRYEFGADGTKTATEVISEKSDLFRNLKKHEIVMLSAMIGLAKAVFDIEGVPPETEVAISFDDSIIEDKNAEFVRRLQMAAQGMLLPEELRSWYLNEPIETSKAVISGIAADDIAEE